MINTPSQPINVKWYSSVSSFKRVTSFDTGTHVNVSPAEEISLRQSLIDKCCSYIDANSGNQTHDLIEANRSGATYVSPGTTFQRPPDLVSIRKFKEGSDNPNYTRRSREGEIVLSDYEVASFRVRQTAGLVSSGKTLFSQTLSSDDLVDMNVLTAVPFAGRTRYFIPGTPYFLWSIVSGSWVLSYGRESFRTYDWVFQPVISPSDVLSACRLFKPDVTSLVTNTLAKANRSSVDVLTAFAEMPKAISSLYSGISLVSTILRDAKKGKFDLDKAHAFRKKRMTKSFRKRMARLDRELANPNLSLKRREALIKHKLISDIRYRDTLKRSADELASATADVWLNYRYNIMPNVYLAQDIYDAVEKYSREWITARGMQGRTLSIPLIDDIRVQVDIINRVMIKRRFSARSALSGQSVISSDIFTTAWELVPLSFVYDWFLNIGDLLTAQTYNVRWDVEGSTKSLNISINSEIGFSDPVDYAIPPTTFVDGKYYRREVINPIDECGLVWQPSVGLERKLDALALSWRPVRSLLLKGRNR